MKNKQGESIAEAFKAILKDGPDYLWTDKESEFYNKHVKGLLCKNKITLYSTENEEKPSVVERWNRTIKTKMWKQFTIQGYIWWPRTAIRNFPDSSRKLNFCDRLILKLLHFFF